MLGCVLRIHHNILISDRFGWNCGLHNDKFTIYSLHKKFVACLRPKSAKIENLLDVLKEYVILGFCRLD